MTRSKILAATLTAAASAVLLAACGTTSGTGGDGSTNSGAGGISTRNISGVGTVLVDATGKTLYSADVEASGRVLCTGECVRFWIPAIGTSAKAPSGVTGAISAQKRADTNLSQFTYNGAPLYTFYNDDAAGDAKGNGVKDAFGAKKFSWSAVIITPSAGGQSTTTPTNDGSGYGGY